MTYLADPVTLRWEQEKLISLQRSIERAKERKTIISQYVGWRQQVEDETNLIAFLTVECDELRQIIQRRQAEMA